MIDHVEEVVEDVEQARVRGGLEVSGSGGELLLGEEGTDLRR